MGSSFLGGGGISRSRMTLSEFVRASLVGFSNFCLNLLQRVKLFYIITGICWNSTSNKYLRGVLDRALVSPVNF